MKKRGFVISVVLILFAAMLFSSLQDTEMTGKLAMSKTETNTVSQTSPRCVDDGFCAPDCDLESTSDFVAYYEFEGNAADSSGNNNHGTLGGGAVITNDPQRGSVLNFGSPGYMEAPDSASLDLNSQVTITAWIKPTTIMNYRRLVEKSHSSATAPFTIYGLIFNSAKQLRMSIATGGSQKTADGSTQIRTGIWTFVAGTYDGSSMKVYVNGVLDGSAAHTGLIDMNNMPLSIGRSGYNANYYNGMIDDVRVYNRALTQQEILDVYYGFECENEVCEGTEDCDTCFADCDPVVNCCGDGKRQGDEVGDGNSQSCKTTGGYNGNENCLADCSGFGNCVSNEYCGDNVRNGYEECDGSDNGSCQGLCNSDCTCGSLGAVCGDGVIDDPEQCDDGNTNAGDGCDSNCAVEDGWNCSGEPSFCTSGCNAGDATENTARPFENGYDFIPFGQGDKYKMYEVYSTRDTISGPGGVVDNNVGTFIIELTDGNVAVVGSGYGNHPYAHNNAVYDANNVEEVLQNCIGKSPQDTEIVHIAVHGHRDHTNPWFLDEMQSRGWVVTDIIYHKADNNLLRNIYSCGSGNPDCNLFRRLSGATCYNKLVWDGTTTQATFDTMYGKLWLTWRGDAIGLPPGHTPGSIDVVIDVDNNPEQRMFILGSDPATGSCRPIYPSGTKRMIDGHGNACTGNPAFSCQPWN